MQRSCKENYVSRFYYNEVSMFYSWDGAKKKKIFKNLVVASVILCKLLICLLFSVHYQISFIKCFFNFFIIYILI